MVGWVDGGWALADNKIIRLLHEVSDWPPVSFASLYFVRAHSLFVLHSTVVLALKSFSAMVIKQQHARDNEHVGSIFVEWVNG